MPVWLVLPLYVAYCFSSFVSTLLVFKYSGAKDENAEAELSAMVVITIISLTTMLMIAEIRGVPLMIALLIPIVLAVAIKAISTYITDSKRTDDSPH